MKAVWVKSGIFAVAVGLTSVMTLSLAPRIGAERLPGTYRVAMPSAERVAEYRRSLRVMAGGKYYKPLRMLLDCPPVFSTSSSPVDGVELPDDTPIIGLNSRGEPFAVALKALRSPDRHIVNLMVNEEPISVSYCDLKDCVRVLSRRGNSPIPLRVSGLDVDNQMVFLLEGQRYGQTSMDIPLEDYPFQRTTLGEWKRQFPNSRIYLGGWPPAVPRES